MRVRALTVTAMGVDGLEKTQGDPNVDSENMQILREVTVQQRS